MKKTIGIRREDKNEWERRVPLVPADLAFLKEQDGFDFVIQPSSIRTFSDDEYRASGIEVDENLDPASVIFAVKEIPIELLRADTTYVFFSHVIKGQPHNMPMLARLMELGCSLLDYETIADDDGQRLIFFGVHAGYAGMIEAAWCLDRRLGTLDRLSPFQGVRHAYQYEDLEEAKRHLERIGERTRVRGLESRPVIVGLAGYGNVSRGCQEILSWLGAVEVGVDELPGLATGQVLAPAPLLFAIFKEEHMVQLVEPVAAGSADFELQDYYDHPEKYRGCFDRHLPYLDMLVNTTYWDARYPRLVTRSWARENYGSGRRPRLQAIADISCDLEGGIELTVQTTQPDAPCFTYDPQTDSVEMGYEGRGPVVMAVDNLPCELPRESSEYFSRVLRTIVPSVGKADWRADLDSLALPPYLKRALIVHKGDLTPDYDYLNEHLKTTT